MERRSKSVRQQERYYEVENIFDYMVETYLNGNITSAQSLYRELSRKGRNSFLLHCLDMDNRSLGCKVIKEVIINSLKS